MCVLLGLVDKVWWREGGERFHAVQFACHQQGPEAPTSINLCASKVKKKSSPPSPLTHSKTLSFFLSFGGNIRHNIFSFFSLFLPPICTSTTRPTSLLSCLSTCQFIRQKKGPALKRERAISTCLFSSTHAIWFQQPLCGGGGGERMCVCVCIPSLTQGARCPSTQSLRG